MIHILNGLKFLLLSAALLLYSSCGPELSAVSGASALVALDGLEKTIEDITNELDYVYNKSANNTAVHIKAIIYDLRYSIDKVLDKGSEVLTKQQADLLDNIIAATEEFDELSRERVEDFQVLTNTIGQIVSDLPFTPNEARITKPEVSIYVRNYTESLSIKMAGYNLDHESNVLSINGEDIKPSNQTSTNIEFIIPDSLLQTTDNKIKFVQATQKLYFKKGWGPFSSKQEKALPIAIKILPKIIGTARIYYQVDELTRQPQTIVGTQCGIGTGGTDWRGKRRYANTSCTYNAPKKLLDGCGETQGIIVGSVGISVNANRHGGNHKVDNLTSTSFVLNVQAQSDSGPYKGGGLYVVTPTYKVEYPCEIEVEKRSDNAIPIEIGKDLAYDLNNKGEKNPRLKRVFIRFFDGTEVYLTNDERKKSLVTMSANASLEQVIIRPIEVPK